MNPDFLDLLAALVRAEARFLVVGAHAMAAHGVPRATGDLDVWVQASAENAARVWEALIEFGAPVRAFGLSQADLTVPGVVFQMGEPGPAGAVAGWRTIGRSSIGRWISAAASPSATPAHHTPS